MIAVIFLAEILAAKWLCLVLRLMEILGLWKTSLKLVTSKYLLFHNKCCIFAR